MEDALVPPVPPAPLAAGAAAPATFFLTRRRSHLDSASYRTLSRLFSHCLHLHPQQHAVPAHPVVETAAANPICGVPPQGASVPPKDAEFERRNDLAEESAVASTSVPEGPVPSVVEAAAGNPIAGLDVAPQGSVEHEVAGVEEVEGVEDMVVVGSPCRKPGASVEEFSGEAELMGADEVLRTMKAQSVGTVGFEEGEIEDDLQDLDDESEHQDADDQKLEEDCVTRGSGENESSGHDIRCLNLVSTPKIKGTSDLNLILDKEDTIKSDALMHVPRAQVVSYEEIVEWNETPVHDAEALRGGKRKRHFTEERKAKKTKNKRVKRAQQRVADGVKRLKLAPVIKPKVVKYCHFYLHGKCQQGNTCKFSHDTTPLTKSKPCTHFARGSCLKGDDCPYDHELSKYPCHNFVENGTCFRRDKCKFSHVVPTADGPSKSDAKKSDVSLVSEITISRDQTSSQKALTVHDGELVTSAPTRPNSILKNLAGISVNAQKISARTPKGVQFRPSSKDRSDSSMLHQDATPTEKHIYTNAGKNKNFAGPQAAEGDKNVNPNRQEQSSTQLFDEKNSFKEASSYPKKSLPTDSTAVLGSVSTQHEVSEASRILQEFLFGAGS